VIEDPAVKALTRGYGAGAVLAHVTSQFLHQMRMASEYSALQRVALLPGHGADVERICGLLVRQLLQLTAVHQLDVRVGRSRRCRGAS
jgi:hypothetical protein